MTKLDAFELKSYSSEEKRVLFLHLTQDLVSNARSSNDDRKAVSKDDHYLNIDQAAKRLSLTKGWLYRHWEELPFAKKFGKLIRFSSNGIDQYKDRQGGIRQ